MRLCLYIPGEILRCVTWPPPHLPIKPDPPVSGNGGTGNGGAGGKKPPGPTHPISPMDKGIYPEIFTDVATLEAMHHAAKTITHPTCREALERGIEAALNAVRESTAGEIASIEFSEVNG